MSADHIFVQENVALEDSEVQYATRPGYRQKVFLLMVSAQLCGDLLLVFNVDEHVMIGLEVPWEIANSHVSKMLLGMRHHTCYYDL